MNEFVDHLWYFEGLEMSHQVENVMPDGTFELIIDLREEPRKLFQRGDLSRHRSFRRGWISGVHSSYIVIDVLQGASMAGAHFRPGGAAMFLGCPADALADEVVELDAMWGTGAWTWRERLLEARDGRTKLDLLEALLSERFRATEAGRQRRTQSSRRLKHALERLEKDPAPAGIGALAAELGVSHKHFIAEFRRSVGLTPKVYGRICRFQEVLRRIHQQKAMEWAGVACACGYFDQAHFVRDFKEFSGLNPSKFLRHTLGDPRFLPVDDGG